MKKRAILHLEGEVGQEGCYLGIKNSNQKILPKMTKLGNRPGAVFTSNTREVLSLVNALFQAGASKNGGKLEIPINIHQQQLLSRKGGVEDDKNSMVTIKEDILTISQNEIFKALGIPEIKEKELFLGTLETPDGLEPEAILEEEAKA